MVCTFQIRTSGQGLYEITSQVAAAVRNSKCSSGICNVFLQHTSASLIIQENADPSARKDLERWISRFIPEGNKAFTHTLEGPDDMPAHIKSALTGVSLSIPIIDEELTLGTWQGIYLWEHRKHPHTRSFVVHIGN